MLKAWHVHGNLLQPGGNFYTLLRKVGKTLLASPKTSFLFSWPTNMEAATRPSALKPPVTGLSVGGLWPLAELFAAER